MSDAAGQWHERDSIAAMARDGVIQEVVASRATLRGWFSCAQKPVATVGLGERVRFRVPVDVSWGTECHTDLVSPRAKIVPREGEQGGPAMCGPVAIRGVAPGMTVEIRLVRIVPGEWGWTYVGKGLGNRAVMERVGIDEAGLRLWKIDREAGVAVDRAGVRVPMRAFPGTIGLCPGHAEGTGDARHVGWIPTRTGGNMDCALLTAETTLYLPVEVSGGLLYVGDGHAAQGDGECGGTAIECPMEAIELEVHAHAWSIEGPVVVGEHGLATLGFGESAEAAAGEAVAAMVGLFERAGLGSRAECLGLASVAVDVRITQLVNMGTVGAHAVLRRDVMEANGWSVGGLLESSRAAKQQAANDAGSRA